LTSCFIDYSNNDYWEYLSLRPAGAATSLEEIPHQPPSPSSPPKTPVSGTCVHCTGAQNVYYKLPRKPTSGFDALKFTMRPMTDQQNPGSVPPLSYYWAYQNQFVGGFKNIFYFDLQPDGKYGKTALFQCL
jgi:hypothetical protein